MMKKILGQLAVKTFELSKKIIAYGYKCKINHGYDFALKAPRHIVFPENIEVGDSVFVNAGLTALAYDKIKIGDEVMLGPNVSLITSGHDTEVSGLESQRSRIIKPVTIGDKCWIAADAVILPGVSIGTNSVIGAGSVVTKDIPANSIAVGVPCRVIKMK